MGKVVGTHGEYLAKKCRIAWPAESLIYRLAVHRDVVFTWA